MISSLPLVFAIGITGGALFGLPALLLYPASTFVVSALSRERTVWIVVVAALGAALGFGRGTISASDPFDHMLAAAVQVEGSVASVPQMGPSGPRALVEVAGIRVDADGAWQDSFGTVLVFFRHTAPAGIDRDDSVQFRGSVDPLVNLDPDFRRFVQSEGASGVGWAFTTSIQERGEDRIGMFAGWGAVITKRMHLAVPGDAGALLSGFVTGDDSGLSETARAAFDRTNTSHITAVSGANIAILVAMWSSLAPSGRIRRHLVFQVGLLIVIWSYVALVGFGPAALRAALFATLMIPASRFGRKPDAMTSLMLASASLLLLIPEMAHSVGFWLSMAASAALVTVAPIRTFEEAMTWRWILYSLVSAQFATLPITFWVFGQWSPASFIANLIIGPMVSAIFPLAFASSVLFLISPSFGSVIGWVPGIGAEMILVTVENLGSNSTMMRSGPLTGTGALLIAMLSGVVIACLSVDVHRWVRRIEFANRDRSGLLPAGIVGAMVGTGLGLLVVALI